MQMPEVTKSETAVFQPRRDFYICVFLALVTLALYWPVNGFEFNNYDDAQYVTDNPHVLSGLTGDNILWAFTSGHASNWHPLTWLSHMLDCQFFGLNAGGHHLVNLLFHIANTLLLYGLLRRLTGAGWRAAFVAALFALHPMHVESVAWVAERKDVLSAFFGLLTLWAWCLWVRAPSPGRYALALMLFAFALMAKPMLVSIPLLMLLLDFWPLQRFQPGKPLRDGLPFLLEKLPFFALSIASCIVTYLVQKAGGAMVEGRLLPVGYRFLNAMVNCARYLGKLLWPENMAVLYPYTPHLPVWQFIASAALLIAITVIALRAAPRRPSFLFGWLWFLISLGPVIGLVQVGDQSIADRYTYLPAIGFFIMLVWEVPDLLAKWQPSRIVLPVAAAVALIACFLVSMHQLQYWRNSVTLFTRAIQVTSRNAIAHCNLGQAYAALGDSEKARNEFDEALQIDPTYVVAMVNMSAWFDEHQEYDKAVSSLEAALKIRPNYDQAHYNLGLAYSAQGKTARAVTEYRAAIQLNPRYANALANLGMLLAQQGDLTNAIPLYQRALEVAPGNAYAHNALGSAYESLNQPDAATAEYSNAVALMPGFFVARNNLAEALARQGKWDDALAQYSEALRLNPNLADAHAALGIMLAQTGDNSGAIEHYRAALRLNPGLVTIQKYLAWLLATSSDAALRNGHDAVQLATAATTTSPDDPTAWDALAAAQAESGNFPEAVAAATKGINLANASQQTNQVARFTDRLKLYQSGKPFHAPSPTTR
jgi:protein O-mannosyl-transferase